MTEKEIINLIIEKVWEVTKMLDEAPPEMVGRTRAYHAIDSYCAILYTINEKRK
jgi:hypothetical protein